MLNLLFNYFVQLFYGHGEPTALTDFMNSTCYEIDGTQIVFADYFAIICSLVSFIFILVLCCLFIYRLIRVVGRLFMGA